MKIRVRLFASYREVVGSPVVEVPLADDAGGPALWAALVARYPELTRLPSPAGYAVNDEYVHDPRPFQESDEVALIPPVSGGSQEPDSEQRAPRTEPPVGAPPAPEDRRAEGAASQDPAARRPPLIELTDRPISVDQVLHEAGDPLAGAIVLFLGVVRDNAHGKRVRHLEYEAYETLARREIEKIAAAIEERWPVARVVIVHRTGRLGVGEVSVAIAVSAPHRAAAFEAGRFAIDTLKLTVPIWKKEVWEGGEAWVGLERRRGPGPSQDPRPQA